MSDDPTVTAPDLVTLAGYGLGLWWAADGPAWAGLLSILADEIDGRLARATNTTTAHGSALDWGADVALVPPTLARLGRELGMGSTPGLVASPAVLLAQSHLRAAGDRPSVGSARAVAMLAAMGVRWWRNGKFSRSRRAANGSGSVGSMRTILMNPRKTSAPKRRAPVTIVRVNPAMSAMPMMQANPRRRRRRNPAKRRGARIIMVNPRRRRASRRNPLIMPNPRRRRRARSGSVLRVRSNPSMNVMEVVKTAGVGVLAAGAAYALNRFAIGRLFYKGNQHWNSDDNRRGMLYRGALRFVGAGAGAMFLPGVFGAAFVGAMGYPLIQELANWWQYRDSGTGSAAVDNYNPGNVTGIAPQGTQAALEEYAAALDGALGYGADY